jgi:hypothetical protein
MAKVWRIELQIAVLETAVLPLHYTDKRLDSNQRLKVLPLNYSLRQTEFVAAIVTA